MSAFAIAQLTALKRSLSGRPFPRETSTTDGSDSLTGEDLHACAHITSNPERDH